MIKKTLAGVLAALVTSQASALPLSTGDVLRIEYQLDGTADSIHSIMPTLFFTGDYMEPGEAFSFQVFDSTSDLIGGNAFTNDFPFLIGSIGFAAAVSTPDLSGTILLTWLVGSVNLDDALPPNVFAQGDRNHFDLSPAFSVVPRSVPEPGTLALFGLCLVAIGVMRKRARR